MCDGVFVVIGDKETCDDCSVNFVFKEMFVGIGVSRMVVSIENAGSVCMGLGLGVILCILILEGKLIFIEDDTFRNVNPPKRVKTRVAYMLVTITNEGAKCRSKV